MDALCGRLNSAIFSISTLARMMDKDSLKTVYFGYFHSVMSYGAAFWGVNKKTNFNRVFVLQKRAVRVVCGIRDRESCRPIFPSMKIMTLAGVIIFQLVCFAFQNRETLAGGGPLHNYGTRQSSMIRPGFSRKTVGTFALEKMGARAYNRLPPALRDLEDLKKFKEEVRRYLIDRSFYCLDDYMTDS